VAPVVCEFATIADGSASMVTADGDIDVLAKDMIKEFPADAADRAALRSKAFFILGYVEKSKRWLLVTDTIKKILASRS
jgi:hypothetical protein